MKKISALVLFVVFAVFAQQQNTMPIPQDSLPEPVVPLLPAQPLLEEFIPIEPPQPPQPMLLHNDPKDTLPLPPLPPLPPMPLPEDTLSTPTPLPQDTTPQVLPTPTPVPTPAPQVVPPPAPTPAPKDTTPPPPQKPSLPMNTITIDFGPTIIGAGINVAAKTLGKNLKNVDISAFGIGVQYEFQPIRFLSLPVKFAYMDFKTGVKEELETMIDSVVEMPPPLPPETRTIEVKTTLKAKLKAELSIWSVEAHPRLYPFGGSFFLEGMVGYANLATDFSGKAIASLSVKVKAPSIPDIPIHPDIDIPPDVDIPEPGEDLTKDTSYIVKIHTKASRGYLKYGGKLGWRVDFGKPGGFVFEHAIGWYLTKGLGKKTIVGQLADYVEKEAKKAIKDEDTMVENAKADIGKFDNAFGLLEKFILKHQEVI